jgi:ABC-2 type transport system permease protein
MSALSNIIRKELKELLTPATILPILIISLIFGSIGTSMGGIEEGLSQKPTIGVINQDQGSLGMLATSILQTHANVIFNATNISEKTHALNYVENEGGVALIIIPKGFTDAIYNNSQGAFEVYWIMKGAGIFDSISSGVVEGLFSTVNTGISKTLIEDNTTVNASIALAPSHRVDTTYFKDLEFTGISPSTISSILSTQSMFIPIVVMMIIIAAGGTVISSMALEKENKTLETLLTLPVKRTYIVAGKIVASACIGLLFAVIYMIGMNQYFQGFQIGGQINLAQYGLQLTTEDFLLIGITLFLALIAGLALCMLLGTLAKNYKSAQTLTFPVTMLALVPMFITMFADFDTLPLYGKILVFAIPFSHPMMAPRALIFKEYTLVFGGMLYVFIFAAIMIALVVWIFKTDRLLTGTLRKRRLFSRKKLVDE